MAIRFQVCLTNQKWSSRLPWSHRPLLECQSPTSTVDGFLDRLCKIHGNRRIPTVKFSWIVTFFNKTCPCHPSKSVFATKKTLLNAKVNIFVSQWSVAFSNVETGNAKGQSHLGFLLKRHGHVVWCSFADHALTLPHLVQTKTPHNIYIIIFPTARLDTVYSKTFQVHQYNSV